MEDRTGLLLGCRYNCVTCATAKVAAKLGLDEEEATTNTVFGSFSNYHPAVIQNLDSFVRLSFPLLISARSAILMSVVNRMTDDLIHGKGLKACCEWLQQAHFERYDTLRAVYLSKFSWARNQVTTGQQRLASESVNKLKDAPLSFGSFEDNDGYGGYIPSEHYLESVFTKFMTERTIFQVCNEIRVNCMKREGILTSFVLLGPKRRIVDTRRIYTSSFSVTGWHCLGRRCVT